MSDRSPRAGWPAVLGLLALCAAAFLPALDNGFVFDDVQYIVDNARVREGLTADGAAWALTSVRYASNWHPLTWISHMTDVSLFGLEARGHHAVSIVLHGANAVLLFAGLAGLTGALWRPAIAAALFAVHPLRVESVVWVAERKDVLSLFFLLLALLAWLRHLRRPGSGWYPGAIGLFAAALMSKPTAVMFPVLLLVLDGWPLGRWPGRGAAGERSGETDLRWRKLIVEKAPLFLLAALASGLTRVAQGKGGSVVGVDTFPFLSRAGNAAVSAVRYLAKTVWPADLAVIYPHPGTDIDPLAVAGAAVFLGGLSVAAWRLFRRMPWFGAGWLWYLAALAPVAGFIQVGGQAMADRYTYLPAIGVAVALVWGIERLTRGIHRRELLLWPATLALMCSLVLATRGAAAWWRDDRTLFERALRVTEGNWIAELNLGKALETEGRSAEAMERYAAALRLKPRWYLPAYELANLLYGEERFEEAVAFYRRAIDSNPGHASAWGNLGSAFGRLGRFGESVEAFREALRLDPLDSLAWNGLGMSLANLGRLGEASEAYRRAVAADPANSDARHNLATAEEALRGSWRR